MLGVYIYANQVICL